MKLYFEIDSDGIAFRFYPFHFKKILIPKDKINQISVINYDPISQYGGWGIRWSKRGKAYTTNGNFGIQINFDDNKNVLIGTSKPREVYSALKQVSYNPGSNVYM